LFFCAIIRWVALFAGPGFGQETRKALAQRRQWLMEQGLASESQGSVVYRANLLRILRERELQKIGGQLAGELGLPYAPQEPRGRIEGV
jgi:hypothetical protein